MTDAETASKNTTDSTSSWEEEDAELGASMSFLEHLQELRTRLIRSIIALVVAVSVCFFYANPLIELLLKPLPQEYLDISIKKERKDKGLTALDETKKDTPIIKMIATHPVEPIIVQMKVSMVAGIFIAFPFIFYEAWMFIAPGLYKKERKIALPLVITAWLCFILGGLFCYFIIYGYTLVFLATWTPQNIDMYWKISEYITFTLRFMLAFGIVFEEPVIILLLARIGIVNREMLSSFRAYAIVIIFIIAAVITPPDVFSQFMCAIPLYALYEISIIIVRIIEKRREAIV